MKKLLFLSLTLLFLISCKSAPENEEIQSPAFWKPYEETPELEKLAESENPRLRLKLLNSAVAKYPALAVPMGYQPDGEPVSLTFISKPF